jgi:hypothetical protein
MHTRIQTQFGESLPGAISRKTMGSKTDFTEPFIHLWSIFHFVNYRNVKVLSEKSNLVFVLQYIVLQSVGILGTAGNDTATEFVCRELVQKLLVRF